MRSKQTGNKREKEKEKQKKKKEKEQRKEERKKHSKKGMGLEAMMTGPVNSPASAPSNRELSSRDEAAAAPPQSPGKITDFTKTGRVSYINEQKGYGFIRDSTIRENLFFSLSDLRQPVKLNDEVIFTKVKGPRGSTATSIKKTNT